MKSYVATLLLAATLHAANIRVTAINYISPTFTPNVLPYVPRWAQKAIDGAYNPPSGQEILFDILNVSTGYYELWSCAGGIGLTPNQVCATGTQVCISCTSAFKTLTWGSSAIERSIGTCSWSHSGLYVVCSVQDANSLLPGLGLPVPLSGTVTTSGTAVTRTSGSSFTIALTNAPITINNVVYTVATYNSANNLTLASSAGVQAVPVAYAAEITTADPGVGGDMHAVVYNRNFTAKWQIDNATAVFFPGPGGNAQGFSANGPGSTSGTRAIPINGTRGIWFLDFNADDTLIAGSNNTCFVGVDPICTNNVLGTEIEVIPWTPGGSFPSTAAINGTVAFIHLPGVGGVTCSGSTCNNNTPQFVYEFEGWFPTDPLQFYVASFNFIQNGNPLVFSLHGAGSAYANVPPCSPVTDPFKCHWSEHTHMAPDGQHFALASTYVTGPIQGEPTASPVFFPVTYPPFQGVAWLDTHYPNPIAQTPPAVFPGVLGLTNPNIPGNQPEYIDSTLNPTAANKCHNRSAALQFSPDNKYILSNAEETTQAGGVCPGGHGTFGFSFLLMSIQPEMEVRGGAKLRGGAKTR